MTQATINTRLWFVIFINYFSCEIIKKSLVCLWSLIKPIDIRSAYLYVSHPEGDKNYFIVFFYILEENLKR